jgi:hypothetical protein
MIKFFSTREGAISRERIAKWVMAMVGNLYSQLKKSSSACQRKDQTFGNHEISLAARPKEV